MIKTCCVVAMSVWLVILGCTSVSAQQEPLRVAVTVPELGSLAREVGGEQVAVVVFAKGTEDAHFVEAKPSFIKGLSQADVYIQAGMELEMGWAPVLLQNARNSKVLPGAPGYVDASTVIIPLEVPTGPIDRSMGDVHPGGNPHYLTDPLNGLRVAELLRDKFSALRSTQRAYFAERYTTFRKRVGAALVGETLAQTYDVTKLAVLFEHGRLGTFLQSQNEAHLLGGWLGRLLPYGGTKAVADHNLWPYFTQRFGLTIRGSMEPKPGVPPTTRHLQELVQTMQAEKIGIILTSVYYDPRHAQFLAQHTGAKVVPMAHQSGARPGTDDYLGMVDYNVRQLVAALENGRGK